MRPIFVRFLCALLLLLPAIAGSGTAAAADLASKDQPLTREDAEAWLDGYLPYALASGGIPGAVVTIVKDGRVVLSKGYGMADVAKGIPVDPEKTLFRVGSVSKLFTWTAVMQLVEQGRIDLDADINHYLDFAIPPLKGQPLTMRQLMTHTAGFEEARRGTASFDPHLVPLGATLKRDVPPRIFAPGTTPTYSNYGTALAGYIVERLSGEPFELYVQRHILTPLAMSSTSFAQPLPDGWRTRMAQGYVTGGAPAQPFEMINWSPAGGLSTTGDDMAHFMIAHLHHGAFGDAHILSERTARMMQETPLTLMPGVNRMLLGFYELDGNGRRAIGHHGDTILFHALVALFPDDDVGIFMAFNAMGRGGAVSQVREQLFQRFSQRYLPGNAQPAPPLDPQEARAHNRMFASAYENSRGYFHSFLAFTHLLDPVRVLANRDGTISLSGYRGPDGTPKRFREVAPFRWRQVGGPERMSAVVEDGRIVRFAASGFSQSFVMLSVPWWRSPVLLRPAFLAGATLLLLFLMSWPAGAAIRWRHGLAERIAPARVRARRWTRAAALVALAALAGWGWLLAKIMTPSEIYLLAEHDAAIMLVQIFTIIGFGGAVAAAAWKLVADWRAGAGWWVRGADISLLVGAGVMTWTAALYGMMALSVKF